MRGRSPALPGLCRTLVLGEHGETNLMLTKKIENIYKLLDEDQIRERQIDGVVRLEKALKERIAYLRGSLKANRYQAAHASVIRSYENQIDTAEWSLLVFRATFFALALPAEEEAHPEDHVDKVSSGVEKGPPIGVQKGPPVRGRKEAYPGSEREGPARVV
jgi:hypothetical protein